MEEGHDKEAATSGPIAAAPENVSTIAVRVAGVG